MASSGDGYLGWKEARLDGNRRVKRRNMTAVPQLTAAQVPEITALVAIYKRKN